MLVVVLARLPSHMVDGLIGTMLTWVIEFPENTLLTPVSIIYSAIESLELLPVVLNLGLEHLETEASLQTPEEWI
jgi:hypothetical protein